MRSFLNVWTGIAICAFGTGLWSDVAHAGPTVLETVRARKSLVCGVGADIRGFSVVDDKGNWSGMDVDVCRAVAAAVFGDAGRVTFRPLNSKERFTAVQSGEVDVLARVTTYSLGRNTALGIDFPAITYYDGQGFMVRKSAGIKSAANLAGVKVCVEADTTTALNAADFFNARGARFEMMGFAGADEALQAYEAGKCDAVSGDHSGLAALRLKLKAPGDHTILPEIISKEPLAPGIRSGDYQWSAIVRWTVFAMIAAEELGITSRNADQMKSSSNPEVRRLLGIDADLGRAMGLPADWSYAVIRQVGNYGECFERNFGKDSGLGIRRGLNALWKDGGIQYAPPIR